ncbi:class I SAM-dependent methyltransferase [Pleurocapsa sp. CCALA 161]|uniref:class I SAM-dependent methyltransferase n=1 Tax=Pleurocapsa sp. CCALA 161 TaxID=2107688 RepID=UPI000D076D22|nr:class I SAM-dependent methyltransferase [Pleurocapsa sp. CCALA 161]PSB07904.1 class I SAM-dependent methyltransferase [Pleurocapsa sp. CCALA 161]
MTKSTLKRDWNAYYDAVSDRPPRETLLTALAGFKEPGIAIDLGSGDGRDTVEMLRQNWAVLAIDREPDAINRLLARPHFNTLQLITQIVSFEQLQFPKSVDLINASFSLPFCSTDAFPSLWNQIFNSLVPGGRFCGHWFGDRDSWKNSGLINTFTLQQVEALLKPYTIELLESEEHPGTTPLGEDRYWHVFHIVARK